MFSYIKRTGTAMQGDSAICAGCCILQMERVISEAQASITCAAFIFADDEAYSDDVPAWAMKVYFDE